MNEQICTVTERLQLNGNYVRLSFANERIARDAMPGQFVNMATDRLLRRPLGIMQVNRMKGEFSVGIRILGQGTRYLAALSPGQTVSVLGPLGHGFSIGEFDRVITVGGGTGVFPLFFLQQYCRENNVEGIAVCGYRSDAESILTEEFATIACASCFSSDAGDLEVKGNAGQALESVLSQLDAQGADLSKTLIAACGPEAMLRGIHEISLARRLACQVSLEQRMACGIGVCLVCVCKIHNSSQPEGWEHQRCCVEGPVFDAREVLW